MQRLDIENILRIHDEVIRTSGGSQGVRDRRPLESALVQPFQSFGGEDLYPGIVTKGAALLILLSRTILLLMEISGRVTPHSKSFLI
jgi:prophage maintenance system killer protein